MIYVHVEAHIHTLTYLEKHQNALSLIWKLKGHFATFLYNLRMLYDTYIHTYIHTYTLIYIGSKWFPIWGPNGWIITEAQVLGRLHNEWALWGGMLFSYNLLWIMYAFFIVYEENIYTWNLHVYTIRILRCVWSTFFGLWRYETPPQGVML